METQPTVTVPGNCPSCGHPLRHPFHTLQDYPGTQIRRPNGLCTTCSRAKAAQDAANDPNIQRNRNTLLAYVANRRARGIPPGGTPHPNQMVPRTA